MNKWETEIVHPLEVKTEIPERMNNLFSYEPHPLCVAAREKAMPYVEELVKDEKEGKMFGVLIVEKDGEYGYLAAYSGQIRGRSDWPGFVPAVYDYLQPDGYFKQHEAEISALTQEISRLQQAPERLDASSTLAELKRKSIEVATQLNFENMKAKIRRHEIRAAGPISKEEEDTLIRESQFMKAETRRVKKGYSDRIEELQAQLESLEVPIRALKAQRKKLSDALQHWLFERFYILNYKGERKNLIEIFKETSLGRPPSGAGECCEPKLLQYAYEHGLRPLQMAMFWVGASPSLEIRHNGRFYPACRGKCLPILRWMMPENLEGNGEILARKEEPKQAELPTIYEDEAIAVVNKPFGLLSVPGVSDYYSVWSIVRERYPDADSPLTVHRLDQPTSGVMLIGKTKDACVELQRQFAEREVQKRYVALLEQPMSVFADKKGVIDLPLYSDPLNRPYQSVDFENGKKSVTEYEIIGETDGHARVALYPKTGRTHQLRVHCAHAKGLNNPVLGDMLYGSKSSRRLFLHAESIRFRHPTTGEEMFFQIQPEF
ncbi:MAG: RluA family pseudouridine synthase [Prevotella sp.]|nr:RluA family pseudouridine synthase [Prevotella sp.]